MLLHKFKTCSKPRASHSMAPPASLSVERLQRFGLEAVRKVRRKEQVAYSVTLSCEYLGVAAREGRFDASSMAQANLNVGFEWRVKANAYEYTHIVTVRCDHLTSRGVPFPQSWRTALQSLDLDDIVSKTVERVIAQSGSHGVRCQLLGRPPPAQLSEEASTTGAFATSTVLNTSSVRMCSASSGWPIGATSMNAAKSKRAHYARAIWSPWTSARVSRISALANGFAHTCTRAKFGISSRHRHATLTCLLPLPRFGPRRSAHSYKDVASIRQLRYAASRGTHLCGQKRRGITGTSPSLLCGPGTHEALSAGSW